MAITGNASELSSEVDSIFLLVYAESETLLEIDVADVEIFICHKQGVYLLLPPIKWLVNRFVVAKYYRAFAV